MSVLPKDGAGKARKRILVVDDSGTTLMMVKMILGREPYDVTTAGNGKEAIAAVERDQFDLVLLDIVMPEMDGFETCARLRTMESTKLTPVIMVTTRGESHNLERAYELGCNDYVTKPVNSLELLTKVRSCLASSDQESEVADGG